MKKVLLAVLAVLLFASFGYAADLNLRATWTANTDTATTGYKIYRTDGTRTLVATVAGKTTATANFTVTVPDNYIGTLRFVMTAMSATKESADSLPATLPLDLTPVPAVPGGFNVVQQ